MLEYAMLILALLGNQGIDVIAMTRVTSNKAAQYIVVVIIIIIKGIYIAQVRKGHKCAMSAEMAVWLRNCVYLYSYLSHCQDS